MGEHDYNADISLNEVTILECRTCLRIMSPNAVLFNIFQKWNPAWDGMENTIAEDLEKLTNVKVKQSDKHSKVICRNCYELLHSACAFTTVVKQSDQILRQRYPLKQEMDNVWPKPIQINKYFNNSIQKNSMNVDIKQEALSDDEYDDAGSIYKNSDVYAKLDIKVEPEEMIQQQPSEQCTVNGSDTDCEYESGAPGPSTKKKFCSEIVHKKCVTTYTRQAFKPSETHSTDNETQRLNKAPKTSAERGREFRARKALLEKQSKQQQEPDAIVVIATEDVRRTGLSEEEKRAKSAEATRRWREKKKGVIESSKKQAKTAAQRMREYRKRKKLNSLRNSTPYKVHA